MTESRKDPDVSYVVCLNMMFDLTIASATDSEPMTVRFYESSYVGKTTAPLY